MIRRRGPGLLPLAWLAMLVMLAGSLPAGAAPQRGALVPIEGRVVDGQGQPVANMVVVLEASRKRFSLRKMGQVRDAVLRQPATADASGAFRIDWSWDAHHNTFALAAGFEARYGDEQGYEILVRRDITELVIEGGGRVDLVVENAEYARWLGRYLEGQASQDEGRIFQEMGRPDKLVVEPGEGEAPTVTAWWYFAAGKVHRFHDGRLHETLDFAPIEPESP